MAIIKLLQGSVLEMKKPHPCGARRMRLLRVGSSCRVVCEGCGRDMEIDRIKLEKAIKTVLLPKTGATNK